MAQSQAAAARAQTQREQLRKENLELQSAVEAERATRLQLERQLTPRHIGAAQKQAIKAALMPFRGQRISIITYPGDKEITRFGDDVRAALEGAGLIVSSTGALVFGKVQPGIAFDVGANRLGCATAVAKAFADAGVCSGPIRASETEDAEIFEITVGPKP